VSETVVTREQLQADAFSLRYQIKQLINQRNDELKALGKVDVLKDGREKWEEYQQAYAKIRQDWKPKIQTLVNQLYQLQRTCPHLMVLSQPGRYDKDDQVCQICSFGADNWDV